MGAILLFREIRHITKSNPEYDIGVRQQFSSFGERGVIFRYHYSQAHSDPAWSYLLVSKW